MPSLRKRVTTYLRQLSFTAEPREGSRHNVHRTGQGPAAGCFITRYLEGSSENQYRGPPIHCGKAPQDLPDLPVAPYSLSTGPQNVLAACTGPEEGVTSIQRSRLHLSAGPEIDFIDKSQGPDELIMLTSSNKPYSDCSNKRQSLISPLDRLSTKSNKDKDIKLTGKENSNTSGSNIKVTETKTRMKNNELDSFEIISPTELTASDIKLTSIEVGKPSTSVNAKVNAVKRLPKYEGSTNRTKPVSETVLKRATRSEKTRSIILVTTTIQLDEKVKPSDSVNIEKCSTDSRTNNSLRNEISNVNTSVCEKPQSIPLPTSLDLSQSKNNKNTLVESVQQEKNIFNQSQMENRVADVKSPPEPIAGVLEWKLDHEHAYGVSTSLYEHNPLINDLAGQPIADCYGLVARSQGAALALADGVNWGAGARLAAQSAVHGCLQYLNTAVFGTGQGISSGTTQDVFVSLLRSIWEAQACIIETGGALSTLTVAVILPLDGRDAGRFVVCSCNVGDSLAYVYSKKHGVREITQGSHDIHSMRDMRDALGALGPVNGTEPELNNLTLSLTIVESGDIVFLTSDGISDNFDPVVGRFAEPKFTTNNPTKSDVKDKKQEHAVNTNNPIVTSNVTNANTIETCMDKNKERSGHNANDAGLVESNSNVQNKHSDKHVTNESSANNNKQTVGTGQVNFKPDANQNVGVARHKGSSSRTNTTKESKYHSERPLQRSSVHSSQKSGGNTKQTESKLVKPIRNYSGNHSVGINALVSDNTRPKLLRSQTHIEARTNVITKPGSNQLSYNKSISGFEYKTSQRPHVVPIPRSQNGLPLITGKQRHDLTLLRIGDLLNYGISGALKPCTSAKALCTLLIDFARMITTCKRKMLEEKELYYKEKNGVLIELTRSQQRMKRKECLERELFIQLPGKLDHATVVAITVGAQMETITETNF